jgi:hypothetical protein
MAKQPKRLYVDIDVPPTRAPTPTEDSISEHVLLELNELSESFNPMCSGLGMRLR